MKLWHERNNSIIDPPEVKLMPGRPKRCRRKKKKTEPRKKYGKAIKLGVKMTCSTSKQTGHNKRGCTTKNQSGVSRDMGQSFSSSAKHNDTQASATTPIISITSNPSSICEDTSRVGKSQAKSDASMPGREGEVVGFLLVLQDLKLGEVEQEVWALILVPQLLLLLLQLHHNMVLVLQDQRCKDMVFTMTYVLEHRSSIKECLVKEFKHPGF